MRPCSPGQEHESLPKQRLQRHHLLLGRRAGFILRHAHRRELSSRAENPARSVLESTKCDGVGD